MSTSTTARLPSAIQQPSGTIPGGIWDAADWPVIVFSHLAWDWVWQRPQQYISRLSHRRPVLFVETYCSQVAATRTTASTAADHPNVTILRMELPMERWGDGAFIDGERRRALQAALKESEWGNRFVRPLLWFYDPMAVTAFAGQLGERGVVYDCMDELAQFKGAPPQLRVRERELLKRANVVFCGGQKMRLNRLPHNHNTHFFGTGVDCEHFGRALTKGLAIAPDVAALEGPVLGYFGVIDERIDYELLAQLADASPAWHVVMVGPTAKVDPGALPRRSNLHWLGARPYAALPAFAKRFSVCLMPFALNEATEYINPTKALEYMAAGRPVVSTALDEVKLNFGAVARIAGDRSEFIEMCQREVKEPSHRRIRRGLQLASENTWEANLGRMEHHLSETFGIRPGAARTDPAGGTLPNLAYV